MSNLDAIIVGAGHNGLTCAAYLGMAGLRVRVFERRDVVGGACVTEEFHPGFRSSTAAYTVSLLQPKVTEDLKLHQRGLRLVERRAQNFLPLPDGRYLLTGQGRTEREIAKFSAKDAARYPAYQAEIRRVVEVLRSVLLIAPPNLGGFGQAVRELGKLAAIGKRLWQADSLQAAFRLFRKSAGDMLDSWFESDPIKAVLAFDAVVGNLASPYTAGSAYMLLHHAFGEVNGKPGVWGYAIGGMGAITQAMASAAVEQGVRIDVGSEVREVLVERDRATGIVLKDGTAVRARAVVANVESATAVSSAYAARRRTRRHGGTHEGMEGRFRNFSYERGDFEASGFYCAARDRRSSHCRNNSRAEPCPTWSKAYRDCVRLGWSRMPIIEIVIPSTLDDSLAPPGAHVASLFCQHVTPQFTDGSTWDQHREAVADLMIETVEAYAPGFRASVIARQSLSPLDLERIFGLPNGDIFHGAMTLDQLFSARPMLGFADYRMPVAGLYLCGSGAHPGGGVTGAPGHNAAQAVIADLL